MKTNIKKIPSRTHALFMHPCLYSGRWFHHSNHSIIQKQEKMTFVYHIYSTRHSLPCAVYAWSDMFYSCRALWQLLWLRRNKTFTENPFTWWNWLHKTKSFISKSPIIIAWVKTKMFSHIDSIDIFTLHSFYLPHCCILLNLW